jgi:hypothetical protein
VLLVAALIAGLAALPGIARALGALAGARTVGALGDPLPLCGLALCALMVVGAGAAAVSD